MGARAQYVTSQALKNQKNPSQNSTRGGHNGSKRGQRFRGGGGGSRRNNGSKMFSKYKLEWEKLGDNVATNIMTTGLRLSFHTKPILSLQPLPRAKISKQSTEPKTLHSILPEKGHNQGSYRSSIPVLFESFPCTKKANSFRPVINLSQLNLPLNVLKFKMEFVPKIALCLLEPYGHHCSSKDAFFPLSMGVPQVLCLRDGRQNLCVSVLALRPISSPWAFTRVIKPIM